MAERSTKKATRGRAWRGIRTRLIGVLLIPTIAALALGGMRTATAVDASQAATRAASIANALPDSFRLALQLQVERDAGSLPRISDATLGKIRMTTDAAIAAWQVRLAEVDDSQDPKLHRDLTAINSALGGIDELRLALSAPETNLFAQTEYTNTLNVLLGLAARLPALDAADDIFRQSAALADVRTAAESLADERTLVTKGLASGEMSQFDLTELARSAMAWEAASRHFYDNTSAATQAKFDQINGGSGDLLGSHAPMQAAIEKLLSTGDPSVLQMKVADWNAVSAQFLAQMAGVITTAASDLAAEVGARRDQAQRDALVSAGTLLAVILLALVTTLLVARSILRPLNTLRQAALDIARRSLPERVRQLEQSDSVGDLSVTPIAIRRRDEIAEVASAFDAVHAEALRLAGEQAQMRANVNRMFVNLSRRSQSLVERQLRLIDELEAGEQDPDHLANLFRLDHLATRMRRNDESLMVLAGGDTGQGARGNVPVLDVLRAASSEVEQFARVEIESGETATFRGNLAGDLVHLLAELVENATNFSPPDTAVVVRTTRHEGALVIEVRDQGIGMTPDELDAANEKLRRAAGLDADVARMMGLVVASRLADRHGLAVELRTNSPRGVVARVEVPATVMAQADARSPQSADAVEAPAPETPVAVAAAETQVEPEAPAAPVAPAAVAPPTPAAPAAPAPAAPAPAAPAAATPPAFPAPTGATSMPRRQPIVADPLSDPLSGPVESVPAARVTPSVRPPENYTPPTDGPIASQPPVESWFTTTVPLRDPEELLNAYLTGQAQGVGGAISNPTAKSGAFGGGNDAPKPPSGPPAPIVSPPPLTSSGLPTRVPRASLPAEQPFDAFGRSTRPAAEPAPAAPVAEPVAEPVMETPAAEPAPVEPVAEPVSEAPAAQAPVQASVETPAETPAVQPPVIDPLIAALAADVLSAPSAQEALAEDDDASDDTSIFASLQSEWFTRRTPLEARRSQPESVAPAAEPASSDWVSPGDEGWRRAAALGSEPVPEGENPLVTSDGLPVRVPGRNLIPGSAAPVIAPAAEAEAETAGNVVPLPRSDRRRNRGLTSFQQGVSRARTTEGEDPIDPLTDGYEPAESRAHEEHQ